MKEKLSAYLAGMLTALAVTALLLILLTPRKKHAITLLPPPTPGPVRVHVAGAVNMPGVYDLDWPAHVEDAVEAAGGATEHAELDRMNLAEELVSGERVFVPASVAPEAQLQLEAGFEPELLVDINHASLAQLETLPGIGPSLSKKIVEYREQHGFFTSVDELLNVSGIGPAKLEQFQDYIRIE